MTVVPNVGNKKCIYVLFENFQFFELFKLEKKPFRVMTTESAGENGGGNRKNPRPEVQLYRPGITRLSRSEHEAQQEQMVKI